MNKWRYGVSIKYRAIYCYKLNPDHPSVQMIDGRLSYTAVGEWDKAAYKGFIWSLQ